MVQKVLTNHKVHLRDGPEVWTNLLEEATYTTSTWPASTGRESSSCIHNIHPLPVAEVSRASAIWMILALRFYTFVRARFRPNNSIPGPITYRNNYVCSPKDLGSEVQSSTVSNRPHVEWPPGPATAEGRNDLDAKPTLQQEWTSRDAKLENGHSRVCVNNPLLFNDVQKRGKTMLSRVRTVFILAGDNEGEGQGFPGCWSCGFLV